MEEEIKKLQEILILVEENLKRNDILYTNVLKTANETCSSLYISDPFKKKKEKDSIFSTHPSIANRIERLRNIK